MKTVTISGVTFDPFTDRLLFKSVPCPRCGMTRIGGRVTREAMSDGRVRLMCSALDCDWTVVVAADRAIDNNGKHWSDGIYRRQERMKNDAHPYPSGNGFETRRPLRPGTREPCCIDGCGEPVMVSRGGVTADGYILCKRHMGLWNCARRHQSRRNTPLCWSVWKRYQEAGGYDGTGQRMDQWATAMIQAVTTPNNGGQASG